MTTDSPAERRSPNRGLQIVLWALAIGCFYVAYAKIAGAAHERG